MTDPRETLSNGRVAHVSLRDTVQAEQFVPGERRRVSVPVADIARAPGSAATQRQVLMGEPFLVLEDRDGQAFGQAELSGYVGYLASAELAPWVEPTHVVSARSTFAFSSPDFKSPGPVALSLGSRLTITGSDKRFFESVCGHFIPANHLRPAESVETDPVGVAERLLSTPYLWGGNSAFGIDCSGLVQIALGACGIACPGDSDQQEKALGKRLPQGSQPRRGDLLFWKGHVAWVVDEDRLLHANAWQMATACEPLRPAISRIADQGGGPVTSHVRVL